MAKKLSASAVARYLEETAPWCFVQNQRAIDRMLELAAMAKGGMSPSAIVARLKDEAMSFKDERPRRVYREAAADIASGRV